MNRITAPVRLKPWQIQRLRDSGGVISGNLAYQLWSANSVIARDKINSEYGMWFVTVDYRNHPEIINNVTGYLHPVHYYPKDDYRNDSWF